MTTLTPTTPTVPARPRSSLAVAPRVGFHRLALIELRKLVDTRAALGVILATIALSAVLLGSLFAFMATGDSEVLAGSGVSTSIDAGTLVDAGTSGLRLLLPVMAILLATSEWTQRGAISTFTLEPRRVRVLAAKLVAVVAASAVVFVVVAALSLAAGWAFSTATHTPIDWTLRPAGLAWMGAMAVFSGLTGLALGMFIMNTAGAVTVYFVTPMVLQGLALLGERFAAILSWVNTAESFGPLVAGTGDVHWGKVAVSTAFWVVVPLVAGGVRLVRREIK